MLSYIDIVEVNPSCEERSLVFDLGLLRRYGFDPDVDTVYTRQAFVWEAHPQRRPGFYPPVWDIDRREIEDNDYVNNERTDRGYTVGALSGSYTAMQEAVANLSRRINEETFINVYARDGAIAASSIADIAVTTPRSTGMRSTTEQNAEE